MLIYAFIIKNETLSNVGNKCWHVFSNGL